MRTVVVSSAHSTASNRAKSEDSINTSEGTPSTCRDADWFFYVFSSRLILQGRRLVFLCIFYEINPAGTQLSEQAKKS